MSKLKACPSCENEVSKSAKACPNCGKKLKTGLFTKIITALLILGVLGYIAGPSKKQNIDKLNSTLASISAATPEKILPNGEISNIFSIGSDYTDIQRENKEKEIKGKIVNWNLEVYEVQKKEDNVYRIRTSSMGNTVGVYAYIYTRNPDEVKHIESIKTGNNISLKGKIKGTRLRHILINPAILQR